MTLHVSTEIHFAEIATRRATLRVEYEWIARGRADRPLVVFLHEGLGSRSMWKDFPRTLCERGGLRGLVYSRPGYGRSTPRGGDERWTPDFMHTQAHEVLPKLLAAVGLPERERPWLFGHSDGGSIALLYAARYPNAPAGVICVAPHLFVEPVSIASIENAREAFMTTDMRSRLARHHDDVDSAFFGWNDIWLDPAFASWNIVDELRSIVCPVLAVQGEDDEYGTFAQVKSVVSAVPHTKLVKIARCGHSPHRDQPERLLSATIDFVSSHSASQRARSGVGG
ncbi:MAG TPA: alpha/beta hydrolase [Casimicrobiaceae bacterium]|nr:alpha/beta hydrolase [Casimicrobiaceae bacterium]